MTDTTATLGAATPLQMFPEALRSFAQVPAMTHVAVLMQTVWSGGDRPVQSAGILLGMMMVGGGGAARLFRWE